MYGHIKYTSVRHLGPIIWIFIEQNIISGARYVTEMTILVFLINMENNEYYVGKYCDPSIVTINKP